MWWHILVHQVMLVVFAAFCIIDIEPETNLGTTLKVASNLGEQFMLYSLFHIHSMGHNTAITTGFKTCHFFLVFTICVPLSDENIYKYMMHAFKCIYTLSCVVTLLARKGCGDVWSELHVMHGENKYVQNFCRTVWREVIGK